MDIQAHRKDEHVIIAEKLYKKVAHNGLDEIQLIFDSLPELALENIDLSTNLAGYPIKAPFFVNAMTGGSPETKKLNRRLAKIAAKNELPMATGSQSVALTDPSAANSFKVVREESPNGIVLANLGASHGPKNALAAIQMLKAQVLEIHLNPGQELVMPEGERSFKWSDNLKELVHTLPVPVLVKEVGGGLSPQTLQKLHEMGVKYVDLAGSGGTDFIAIENERRKRKEFSFLEEAGLSTAQSLLVARKFSESFSFTASGGIRNALDIVKCLVLGADNVGISGLFLHTLLKQGDEQLDLLIRDLKSQIAKIMLLLGCCNIAELHKTKYVLSAELKSFEKQINE